MVEDEYRNDDAQMNEETNPRVPQHVNASRSGSEPTLATVSNRDHSSTKRGAKPGNDGRLVDMEISDLRVLIRDVVRDAMERKPMRETGELLTTDQLAKLMKISPDAPRKWRRQGCPHVRVGERKLRWRMADVLRWREERDHG